MAQHYKGNAFAAYRFNEMDEVTAAYDYDSEGVPGVIITCYVMMWDNDEPVPHCQWVSLPGPEFHTTDALGFIRDFSEADARKWHKEAKAFINRSLEGTIDDERSN